MNRLLLAARLALVWLIAMSASAACFECDLEACTASGASGNRIKWKCRPADTFGYHGCCSSADEPCYYGFSASCGYASYTCFWAVSGAEGCPGYGWGSATYECRDCV